MSKKDFIALADAIKDQNQQNTIFTFGSGHLHVLANFCQKQNPKFNKQRWLDYIAGNCGPNGGAK